MKKIKVVSYIRVSTPTQVEKGEGLEIQRERIQKFCEKNNYEIIKEFEDPGISGAKDAIDRPAVMKMINFCKNPPIQYVIIDKPDRMSRNFYQMLHIEKELLINKVEVLYADNECLNPTEDDDFMGEAMKKAMRQIMGVFAELDRKMINKRLSDGKRKKAESGNKPAGRQPFGYEYGLNQKGKSITIINKPQAKIIKKIFNMRINGYSLQQIANELNNMDNEIKKEIYTGVNKKRIWSKQSVKDTLENDYYIGKITHEGKKIDGNHESIIDMDVWNKVNNKI